MDVGDRTDIQTRSPCANTSQHLFQVRSHGPVWGPFPPARESTAPVRPPPAAAHADRGGMAWCRPGSRRSGSAIFARLAFQITGRHVRVPDRSRSLRRFRLEDRRRCPCRRRTIQCPCPARRTDEPGSDYDDAEPLPKTRSIAAGSAPPASRTAAATSSRRASSYGGSASCSVSS